MECEHFNRCGFIKFMREHRGNVVPNGECPKDSGDCIRLNPSSDFNPEDPGLISREEIEIANPPLWTDETGRERRV